MTDPLKALRDEVEGAMDGDDSVLIDPETWDLTLHALGVRHIYKRPNRVSVPLALVEALLDYNDEGLIQWRTPTDRAGNPLGRPDDGGNALRPPPGTFDT